VDNERLQKVLENYSEKFESFNSNENHEIYKWTAVSRFQKYWDLDAENFGAMFKNAMGGDENLISESAYQPINGVVFLCKHSHDIQEAVRDEFRKLLASDDSDYAARQKRAEAFVTNMNSLLNMVDADKWKYHQEISSALMYLAFADPEDNFLYRENEVKAFMQYTGVEDEIVTEDSVDFPRYYRMCNEIVEELQQHSEITEVVDDALQEEADRSDDSSVTEIDSDNHILAFDIIYCALNYELYDEMPAAPKKKRRKKAAVSAESEQKKNEEAKIRKEIRGLKAKRKKLTASRDEAAAPSLKGSSAEHKKYGKGTVTEQDGRYLTVSFDSVGEKKFILPEAVTKGFLTFSSEVSENCRQIHELDEEIRQTELQERALEVQLEGTQE
jgi:hypothetical protein